MKKMTFVLLSLAGALSLAAGSANANCVDLSAPLPDNDMVLSDCLNAAPGWTTCDMNGVQDLWATHGVLALSNAEIVLSWTKNSDDATEEYVCRIDRATGAGSGVVHEFSGIAGVPKAIASFDCRLAPVCGD